MEYANDTVIYGCKNTCNSSGKGRSGSLKQKVVSTELYNRGSSKVRCASRTSEAVRVQSENLDASFDEVRILKSLTLIST